MPFPPRTIHALFAALALAACPSETPEGEALEGEGIDERAEGLGVTCIGTEPCSGGGNVYTAVYRVGAGPTSEAWLLQTFKAKTDGAPGAVHLVARSLRPFTSATPPAVHAQIFGPVDPAAPDLEGLSARLEGQVAVADLDASGPTEFALTGPGGLVAGETYALVVRTDELAAEGSGTVLVGVGALIESTYADGAAFRRAQRRTQADAGWKAARFRAAGSLDVAFALAPPLLPSAPTGLAAQGGAGTVQLTWSAVAGASGYTVKRAATTGGPYSTIGTTTTASFTDGGLAAGTTWYYVVVTDADAGSSSPSSEVSASTVPPAPTGVTATAGIGQATVTWTAAPAATSYEVRSATSAGGPYQAQGTSGGTSLVVTGLAAGTTHYFVVIASNASGPGAPSLEASATTAPPPPTLSAHSPATGGPGTVVTVTGTNFSPGATLRFTAAGSTTAASWTTTVSATTVRAAVPALTDGFAYDVSLVDAFGRETNTLAGAFLAGATGSATISTAVSVNAANTTYDNQCLTIANGGTVTFAGFHPLACLTIESGGTVTHAAGDAGGLNLAVGGALVVQTGGKIDVSAKGCPGGNGSVGQWPNGTNGTCVTAGGATVRSGGSHGASGVAMGGVANATYDSVIAPAKLGSGGSSSQSGYPAGAGGGLVQITAQDLTLNGAVLADGANGAWAGCCNYAGGGGSGGAIFLSVSGDLSGTGTLYARGGAGTNESGRGGGGRIAVTGYANGTVSAANTGAATIYLQAAGTNGALYADGAATSAAVSIATAATYDTVTVRNTAAATFSAPATTATFTVQSGAAATFSATPTVQALTVNGGVTVSAGVTFAPGTFTLGGSGSALTNHGTTTLPTFDATSVTSGATVTNTGTLVVEADEVVLASGVTLVEDGDLHGSGRPADTIGRMTIQSAGVLSHGPAKTAGLALTVAGPLDVQTGGKIDVSAKGCPGGDGSSGQWPTGAAGACIPTGGSTGRSGGSHGASGVAMGGTSNAAYDSVTAPAKVGAGGGSSRGGYPAGAGGGLVRIAAADLTLNGSVLADGAGGAWAGCCTYAGGGGSGGGVFFNVSGSFGGSGTLYARGGAGTGESGRGGGGRIAVTGYAASTFNPANTGAGTIYLQAEGTAGALYADGAGASAAISLGAGASFDTVAARNTAAVTFSDAATIGTLSVPSGASATIAANVVVSAASVSGGLTVGPTGTLTLPTFDGSSVTSGATVTNTGILVVGADQLVLASGVTLIEDGDLHGAGRAADTIGSVTILSGGVLSHAAANTAGLALTVAGALDVQTGGKIDVSAKGCPGGNGGSGQWPTGTNGACTTTGAATGRSGASHGASGVAMGGTTNAAYDSVTAPAKVGAGGSSGRSGYPGGAGGGLVQIAAADLTLNGSVLADGAGGAWAGCCSYAGGGGSGGGVFFNVSGTFGGSGSVYARGGAGTSESGLGGGGRIAVTGYASRTFAGATGAGTIFLQAAGTNGALYADGAGASTAVSIATAGAAYDTVTVRNTAAANFSAPATTATFTVQSGASATFSADQAVATLTVNGGVTVSAGVTFAPGTFTLGGSGSALTNHGTTTLPTFDASSVTSGATVTNTGTLVVGADEVVLASGVTLVEDGDLHGSGRPADTIGRMTIRSGGVLSHGAANTAGLALTVAGPLDVQTGGRIDVSAKGCPGGDGSSGQWPNGAAGACIPTGGSTGRSGGSHGASGLAMGGSANAAYDSVTAPAKVGAGGGSSRGGYPAGAGGGLVRIAAADLTLNGSVLADGAGGAWAGCCTYAGGGGSGGGVFFNVSGSFGGSGTLYARGGAGTGESGRGGGGRIAVTGYAASTFDPANTGAGTIYLQAAGTEGALYADGAGVSAAISIGAGALFDSMTVRNTAAVTFSDAATIGTFSVTSGASATIAANVVVAAASVSGGLTVGPTGTLTLPTFDGSSVTSGATVTNTGILVVGADQLVLASGVTLIEDGDLHGEGRPTDTIGSMTIQSGGVLSHGAAKTAGLALTVAGTLDVQTGGKIDVSAKGCPGGNGSVGQWPTGTNGACTTTGAATGRSGGSHGASGQAINGVTNATYDSVTAPAKVGAGGSSGRSGYPAGAGGGLVQIAAADLTLDGSVLADGAGGAWAGCCSYAGGGGSGGGVFFNVSGTFGGSGSLYARGGAGTSESGPGGGGRIAVTGYASRTFAGATGTGTTGTTTVGSVYFRSASGDDLLLDGASETISDSGTYTLITARNSGIATLSGDPTVGSLVVGAGGQAVVSGASQLGAVSLDGSTSSLSLSGGATIGSLTMNGGTTSISASGASVGNWTQSGGSTTVAADASFAVTGELALSGSAAFAASAYANVATTTVAGSASLTLSAGGTLGSLTVNGGAVSLAGASSDLGSYAQTAGSTTFGGGGAVAASLTQSGGTLTVAAGTPLTVETTFALSGDGTSFQNGGVTTVPAFRASTVQGSGTNGVTVRNLEGATLEIVDDSTVEVASLVTLWEDADLRGLGRPADTVAGNFSVLAGGRLTHTQGVIGGLRLTSNGAISVQGTVDVSGKGYRGGRNGGSGSTTGETYGVDGAATTTGGATTYAGGSHGGAGGNYSASTPNAPYGSAGSPNALGAGGGAANTSSVGGNGGGLVVLTAATSLDVSGSINADGGACTSNCGGGAGGSGLLSAPTLSGTGQITARGGNRTGSAGSGGGGGRIALTNVTNATGWSGTVLVGGGTGNVNGAAGTLVGP